MAEEPFVPTGAAFTSGGQSYFLPRMTQAMIDDWEAFAASRAIARIQSMASFQKPSENDRAYAELIRQIKVGSLAWDTEDGFESRRTLDGLLHVCWIALRAQGTTVSANNGKDQHPITLADVQAIAKREGGDFLYAKYLMANADPTAPPSASSEAAANSAAG